MNKINKENSQDPRRNPDEINKPRKDYKGIENDERDYKGTDEDIKSTDTESGKNDSGENLNDELYHSISDDSPKEVQGISKRTKGIRSTEITDDDLYYKELLTNQKEEQNFKR